MSKNGIKTALRALFKELWAIVGFSETRGFTIIILTQKIYFDPKMASNLHLKSDFGHFLVDFCLFGQFDQKNWSYPQKVQKISMSKNAVKTALRPLFKKLWAILGFSKTRHFIIVISKYGLESSTKIRFWFFFCRFLSFWTILVNLTKTIDLNPKKFKKCQFPKMVSNRLYGHYLRSYEQF